MGKASRRSQANPLGLPFVQPGHATDGESGMPESDVQGLGIEAVLFEGPERQL